MDVVFNIKFHADLVIHIKGKFQPFQLLKTQSRQNN